MDYHSTEFHGFGRCRSLKTSRENLVEGGVRIVTTITRGGSRAAATSRTECFVIIVNGFQPLTIITKHSILDVAAVLDPPLITIKVSMMNWVKQSEALARRCFFKKAFLQILQYSQENTCVA